MATGTSRAGLGENWEVEGDVLTEASYGSNNMFPPANANSRYLRSLELAIQNSKPEETRTPAEKPFSINETPPLRRPRRPRAQPHTGSTPGHQRSPTLANISSHTPTHHRRSLSEPYIEHTQWSEIAQPLPTHLRPLTTPGPPLPAKLPIPKRRPVSSPRPHGNNASYQIPRRPVSGTSTHHERQTSNAGSSRSEHSQPRSSHSSGPTSIHHERQVSNSQSNRIERIEPQIPNSRSTSFTNKNANQGTSPPRPYEEMSEREASQLPHNLLLADHRASQASLPPNSFVINVQPELPDIVVVKKDNRSWICRKFCKRKWPWFTGIVFIIALIVTPTLYELYKDGIIK